MAWPSLINVFSPAPNKDDDAVRPSDRPTDRPTAVLHSAPLGARRDGGKTMGEEEEEEE